MRDNREKSRPDNTDVQRSISVISAVPEEILSSLLQTENDLAAEYRRRNDPYNYRSVHPADVDDLLSRGWEVQRKGKTRVRLRQKKPHDRLLEDSVWALFRRMRYPEISGKHSGSNIRDAMVLRMP